MKVTIHQPQYIPWAPYFLKIDAADTFVILDTVAFQKNGVQNRNMIKSSQGDTWLTIPVQQKLGTPINEVKIAQANWAKKHIKTFEACYAKAPYFQRYFPRLKQLLETASSDNFSEVVIAVLREILNWMELNKTIVLASELNVPGQSSELILNICQAVNANHYISGLGGKNYMMEKDFEDANITVEYLAPQFPEPYTQCFPKQPFNPELSVVDLLFNCGPDWRQPFNHAEAPITSASASAHSS